MLLLHSVSGIVLELGTILNSSENNASITFNFTVYADQVIVASNAVTIWNASYTLREIVVNLTTFMNWSRVNTNLDSTGFPHLLNTSVFHKTIASNLTHAVNGSVQVDTNGTTPDTPRYRSNSSLYNRTYTANEYTYNSTARRIRLNITGIEAGLNNVLTLDGAAPNITVLSPINNTEYYITNVRYQIMVNDTNEIFNRRYQRNIELNITFDGDEEVSSPFQSYNVIFCVSDNSSNINCSSIIQYSTRKDPFTYQAPSLGGGGGGTSLEANDIKESEKNIIFMNTTFGKMLIEFNKEWSFDVTEKITIKTFDFNNKSLNIDFINIKLLNNTQFISSQVFQIMNGTYEKTFNINKTNISFLSFNISVTQNSKIVHQIIVIHIKESKFKSQFIKAIPNEIMLSYSKLYTLISENRMFVIILFIMIINFILMYYIFKKRGVVA